MARGSDLLDDKTVKAKTKPGHYRDGSEADRMEAGLRKLEQAFFTAALADRSAAGHVDVNAPLVAPGEGQ